MSEPFILGWALYGIYMIARLKMLLTAPFLQWFLECLLQCDKLFLVGQPHYVVGCTSLVGSVGIVLQNKKEPQLFQPNKDSTFVLSWHDVGRSGNITRSNSFLAIDHALMLAAACHIHDSGLKKQIENIFWHRKISVIALHSLFLAYTWRSLGIPWHLFMKYNSPEF